MVVDFPIDQLDMKKKLKAKLGNKIVVRLRFAPLDLGGNKTSTGYEMVALDDNDNKV